MTILPLVGRELLVRARSPAGYWTRFGSALAGILLCLPALIIFQGNLFSQAHGSASAFNGLVTAAFILCCFSGFLTVDGISRERREGTLGLLFLTRVRALDVLLGKFGAAGIASLCALLAFAPVVLLPVLAGGVSGGEAARKTLALFDTMILSLSAGLWASARGRGSLACARSAAVLLILVVFGPLWLALLFPGMPTWPSPLSALGAADDGKYQWTPAPYWISIVAVHAISWALVIGAGIRLRRALRHDRDTAGYGVLKPRAFQPLGDEDAPLEWLARRQRGVRFVWTAAILEALYHGGLLFGGLIRGAWGGYSSWGSSLALEVVEGCLFAWAASRFFIEARRAGELELLLTTPEGARRVVASQWKWLKEVFRLPIVVLVAPWGIYVLTIIVSYPLTGYRIPGYGPNLGFGPYSPRYILNSNILSYLVFCLMTIAGTAALVWAGMWFGWSERSQGRAIIHTVLLAKGVPYLIAVLGPNVLGLLASNFVIFNGQFYPWLMLAWAARQAVELLFYLWLIRWARDRMTSGKRQAEISGS